MTKKLLAIAVFSTLPVAQLTLANTLSPGQSGAPDAFGAMTGLTAVAPLITGSGSASGGGTTLNASYTDEVYVDNARCTGCLDFVIQVTNKSSSSDVIEHVTNGSFASFITDLGYATSIDGSSGGGTVAPSNVDRTGGVGATSTFDFGGGGFGGTGTALTTDYLVIETNATNFQTGALSIQDTNAISNQPAYAPGPEPMSIGLLGGGLALLGGFARWRAKSKKA